MPHSLLPAMISPRWNKVLGDLWGNKPRTVMVVLAIAVGVFAFGVVGTSRSILSSEISAQFRATNPASITMTVAPFDDDLLRAVRGMREVAWAEGRHSLGVSMEVYPGKWIDLELIAVEDFDAVQISTFTLDQGTWPPPRREVLLERSILDVQGMALADSIRIELPDGRARHLRVAGLAHDISQFPSQYFEQGYGFVTLDTLEWLTGSRAYNQLLITVAERREDADHIEAVATTLRERIERDGYVVASTAIPEPFEHWNAGGTDAVVVVMGVVGGFALVLSMFLVINTISALLKQQQRQIGMMKAIGAHGGQITGLYLALVLAFGLLAVLLAIPLGAVGARAFTGFVSGMANYDIRHFALNPRVVATQTLLAVLVPLLAALPPVLRGVSIPAREAISDYGISQGVNPRGHRETHREKPNSPVPLCVFCGFLSAIRHQLSALPRPLLLSLRNSLRRKARLALTLITLTLAGAIFIAVFSTRDSLVAEFEKIFGLLHFDVGVALREPVPRQRAEREALRVEGITGVEAWNTELAQYVRADGSQGPSLLVFGVPDETPYVIPALEAGRWLRSDDRFAVVVAQNALAAEETGFAIGNMITIQIGEQEHAWLIVGLLPPINQPTGEFFVYTRRDDLAQAAGVGSSANYIVLATARHDVSYQYAAARAVEDHFKSVGLLVQESQPMGQMIGASLTVLNFIIAFMLIMAILLAVVGGLGLAGTMSLNVLERTREIGVMRATGAANGMISLIVVAEGVLIGGVSGLLAALASVPVSGLLEMFVGLAFMREPLEYHYALSGAGLWLALSILLGALASLMPARAAARISVREALAYE